MRKETRRLTECSLLTAISVILYLSSLIPGIGFVTILLCCIPATYVTFLYGMKWGIGSSAVATVIISISYSPMEGFAYLLTFAITGIALGHLTRAGNPPSVILLGSTFAVLFSMLLSVYVVEKVIGIDETGKVFDEIQSYVQKADGYFHDIEVAIGFSDAVTPQTKSQQIQTLMKLPISIFILMAFLIVYGNYVAVALVFRRLGLPWEDTPNPLALKAPRLLVPFAIAGYVVPDTWFTQWGSGQIIGANILAVAWFYHYMAGFSLMAWSFNYYNLPAWARFPIMLALIIPLRLGLIIIAGIDAFSDIRHLEGDRNSY